MNAAQPRGSGRQYHTSLGWWIMSHERGGPALLSALALAVLAADTSYVASQWTGATARFGGGFLIGLAAAAVTFPLAKLLGAGKPVGPDRERARRRAAVVQVASLVQIGVLVIGGEVVLGDHGMVGVVLGELACGSAAFIGFAALWIARPRPERAQ